MIDLEAASRLCGVRFDSELGSFSELMSLYLEPGQQDKARQVVAQRPLAPPEIIFAANALPCDISSRSLIGALLNGRTGMCQQAIDAQMSPEFSPWNLVMLGSNLSGHCQAVDLFTDVVGAFDEQQSKSFQLMAEMSHIPIHCWEVPCYDAATGLKAKNYLRKELELLFDWLGQYTGSRVKASSLTEAIRRGNLIRQDMKELDGYLARDGVPIGGLEYYLVQVMLGDYAQDPRGLHAGLRKLLAELELRSSRGAAGPGMRTGTRIYLMGDETQELGLYNAIEEHGGVLVGCDFRLPLYYQPINEGSSPMDSLVDWIWRMPNNLSARERLNWQMEHFKAQRPDAVIINSTVGSRCMPGYERLFRDIIKRELELPVLCIETTLPGENIDKVDYQVGALLQTIAAGF